jgi:hypothetical protein
MNTPDQIREERHLLGFLRFRLECLHLLGLILVLSLQLIDDLVVYQLWHCFISNMIDLPVLLNHGLAFDHLLFRMSVWKKFIKTT